MSTTFEKFEELEVRIMRTVEFVKNTRQEKETAEKDLAGVRGQVARLERELEELKRERDLIKNKIERLLENLTELTEDPSVETEVATH